MTSHRSCFFYGTVISCLLTAYTASASVMLNEVLPDPSGTENSDNPEFVELYNDSEETIDLSGWTIKDLKNNTFASFGPGASIGPHDFLVSYKSRILNNDGIETTYLLDRSGSIVAETTYSDANRHEGEAWSLIDGVWGWSTPTPGETNLIVKETEGSTNIESLPSEPPSYSQNINTSPSEETGLQPPAQQQPPAPETQPADELPQAVTPQISAPQITELKPKLSLPVSAQDAETTKVPVASPEQQPSLAASLAGQFEENPRAPDATDQKHPPIPLSTAILAAVAAASIGVAIRKTYIAPKRP